MPELPEVETVRRTLAPAVGGTISSVWTSGMGLHMARKPPHARLRKLVGARITAVRRHGKYLLLDTDRADSILVHLGMTGRLRIHGDADPRATHTHVVLGLEWRSRSAGGGDAAGEAGRAPVLPRGLEWRSRSAGGGDAAGEAGGARVLPRGPTRRELRFIDARRFGQFDVVTRGKEREHPALSVLGPDALDEAIDVGALLATAKDKRTTLKAFVLDQSVLAGVGNIYASEALWRAQLRPTLRTDRLTAPAAVRLAAAIREVLERALDNGGTTLSDFVDADGAAGENADYLWVYDRAGQPCMRCKRAIKRSVLQGRATYYCPTCQTP
jgi:formamidopyrimidine-DNA glycosylase